GLTSGIYTATLIVESTYCTPSIVALQVIFAVGAGTNTVITGIQNAASFQQGFAPGMLMTIYGANLAGSTQSAKTTPLPTSMDGVSATVNGVAAPLWFVSPGQINLQIPYETPAGTAFLAVNNNGNIDGTPFIVGTTAPGIFNNSGALTPVASAKRG